MKMTNVFPCAYGQEGIYFFDKIGSDAALYLVPYTLEFDAEIDRAALEAALDALIRRHEALRTTFVEIDGQVCQHVVDAMRCELGWEDLSDLDDAARAVKADEITREFAARRFDLAAGPLMRATLMRLANARYTLLLGVHHIVFDGWSAHVMAHELDALYRAFKHDVEHGLPEMAVQYRDFAQWQRDAYMQDGMAEDLAYWRETLSDAPALLELPFDKPRPAVRNYAGEIVRAELPPDAAAGFAALIDAMAVTPFVLFMTFARILLHRISGERDICIGYPVAGRSGVEFEDTIGLFTNMLVLRSRHDGQTTFRQAVERTQHQVFDALAHADLPFDQLIEALEPARSLGWHPLFQVCVTHEANERMWSLDGVFALDANIPTHTSKFDLLLAIEQNADASWCLKAEYSTELFERASIDRMLAQLTLLIACAAADPDQAAARLRLLSDEQRDGLLQKGSGPARELPPITVAGLFEAQVERTPDRAALIDGARRMTYRELNVAANRLAWRLRALGVDSETPVGLLVGRGFDMVVGILGILKAGGCYVPLDANYQAERLSYLLNDSGIEAVVLESELRAALLGRREGLTLVELDDLKSESADVSGAIANPPRLESPAQLAYVMYTSGSTGRPKGVAIDHRAIARLVISNPFLPFERGLTIPQLASASFDPSTLEIWGALLHGGAVALVENHLVLSPAEFSAFLQRHQIKAINFASTLLSRLSHEMPEMFVDVEHIIFGGDRADAAALLRLRQAGVRAELINGYGPTEVTTLSCTHVVQDDDIRDGDVPIGRPFANTSAYILDEDMQPVPVGVQGELYLGGAGLARGYYRQPELTAERFVPNPFDGVPGSRLYRTGDVCIWDSNGRIRYKGRRDGQIKIDGFRVEFGEVLAKLLEHPDVKEAVADVEEDGLGQKRLVAYVVLEPGDAGTRVRGIRRWMDDKLPAYLSPKRIYDVPGIPLTSHGKPDISILRQRAREKNAAQAQRGEFVTGTTARFFELIRELLNVDSLSTDESFYGNGGSSLGAIRLLAKCEQEMGRKLPLSVLLGNSTLMECAQVLEHAAPDASSGGLMPLVDATNRESPIPLSAPQAGLYFVDKIAGGNASYSIRYILAFDSEIDRAALDAGFNALVARHEALRTTFVEVDGQACQRIADSARFELGWEDLTAFDDEVKSAKFDDLTRRFTAQTFDLARGPLLHATLVRLARDRHALLLGIHHIVIDGWSAQVMARELDALYRAFKHGGAHGLPDVRAQYRDFAQWQRDAYARNRMAEDFSYWRDVLAGAPALLELPLDKPRPMVSSYAGEIVQTTLPPDTAANFSALARDESTTLFVVFLTAVSVLLHRISGVRDICIGYPVAGRSHAEFEDTIGLFTNMLVLRSRFDEKMTFHTAVEQTQRHVADALDHANLPFDRLVEALEPARSLGWHPLFQVCVTCETDEQMWILDDTPAREIAIPAQTAKFDLSFALRSGVDGMAIAIEYSTDIFTDATIRGYLENLVELFASASADASITVTKRFEPPALRQPRKALRSARPVA
ncbi:non-ribosomal peptide synthetase [Burkholderia sp. TSV86]|uniref:non-ribosomal peptide synthetase n=1 Tax=Burkholderia sp. TSV86 TaxID=1385594 RepID=UPI00075D5656|nr:non-ribosomal peptide synthetase [Burkholderia sp. TSV86]KVE35539.1 hypothetical protein WS68_06190 [Burkholderia sp. TSV86]